MALNECIPFYVEADDVTGVCTAGVTGKRCVRISGDRGDGGAISVAHALAGGRIFGVSGYDGVTGDFIRVLRGHKILPILAGAAIDAFEEVMVGANGVVVPVTARADAAAATLQTGVVGTNNAIQWTAREDGADGNAITVALVVAGANTALSVDVDGDAITVNVATSAGSAATSTAADVIAAVQADAAANALVTVDDAGASNGTGVVAAVAATPLAGGADETADVVAIGYAVTAADNATDAQIALYA